MPFQCSICGEESTRICVLCTKDACSNHLCEKCARCSDCCECEVALYEESKGPSWGSARAAVRAVTESKAPEPESATPLVVESHAEPVAAVAVEAAPIAEPVAAIVPDVPPARPLVPEPDPDPEPSPDEEPQPGPVEA
jgi:hypothetical protein